MKKIIFFTTVLVLILTANAFGQNQPKKKNHILPEVDDEVLVTFRKRQAKSKTTVRRIPVRKSSHDKYANQEIGYRKKSKVVKKGITHDPEFENWANRKKGNSKKRRTNK